MLNLQHSKILIVDDIPTNIRVLLDVLEEAGFKISIAKNGESALRKAARIVPDLIILDVMMPGLDGFETCKCLKEDPLTRDIPVIFMTALSDGVDKVKGLAVGAVDYITKPLHTEEVMARIRVHLSLRQTQTQLMNEVAERRQAELQLQQAINDLKQAQVHLIQSEKMSSLGQMVAGIAHEINNPINFVSGNIDYAKSYVNSLCQVLRRYQQSCEDPGEDVTQLIQQVDLPFVLKDVSNVLESLETGTDRIRDIVSNLKNFSRLGESGFKASNIHEGLDSTVKILSHRLNTSRYHGNIEIVCSYGELPPVECYANQLNQVFLNILVNAIDAIESWDVLPGDAKDSGMEQKQTITISTSVDDDCWAVVRIADTGPGIPKVVQDRLFDPFFTTKPIGQGTGLGLSISYQIIVEQHHGWIECSSVPGSGTEFTIRIPIEQSQEEGGFNGSSALPHQRPYAPLRRPDFSVNP